MKTTQTRTLLQDLQDYVGSATLADIRAALLDDGYDALIDRAWEIRAAALRGALLWTARRLTTTDRSRIDAQPRG